MSAYDSLKYKVTINDKQHELTGIKKRIAVELAISVLAVVLPLAILAAAIKDVIRDFIRGSQ